MDGSDQGLFNAVIGVIHRFAMASVAFWIISICLGGPLGMVPALAALQREVRSWRDVRGMTTGVFPRMWRFAVGIWWELKLAMGLVLLVIVAVFFAIEIDLLPLKIVIAIAAIWGSMWAHDMATRVSLGLSFRGGLMSFFLLSWFHLIALTLWGVTLVLLLTLSPPLAIAFAPALVATMLRNIEGRVRLFLMPNQGDLTEK